MPEIVVLGWGSIVWEPGSLDLRDGVWHRDGPLLPVELSCVRGDRTLVMALLRGAEPVRTLWAYMGTDSVGEAVWNLSQREGSKPENVGFLDMETGEYWCRTADEHIPTIRDWAREKNGDGAVIGMIIWSDLKPNFERKARKELNAGNVISYLKGLRPENRARAWEYLEKAAEQAGTKIGRTVLEGWEDIP